MEAGMGIKEEMQAELLRLLSTPARVPYSDAGLAIASREQQESYVAQFREAEAAGKIEWMVLRNEYGEDVAMVPVPKHLLEDR